MEGDTTKSKYFINISNQLSSEWDEFQMGEASEIADMLIDINFPFVEPDATESELLATCDKMIETIESVSGGQADVTSVHVLGDMRLTFILIVKLQRIGYRCFASTNGRDVAVTEEGSFVQRLRFDSFREYPELNILD